MLDELIHNRLEVIVQYKEKDVSVRAVLARNAEWYQKFCSDFPTSASKKINRKKFQTRIKRLTTIRGLKALIAGKTTSEYAQRLLPYVEEYAAETKRLADEEIVPF